MNIGGYIDMYNLSWDDGTNISVKRYLDYGDYDDPIESTNIWIHERENINLSGKDFSGFDSVLCYINIFGAFAKRVQSDSTTSIRVYDRFGFRDTLVAEVVHLQ
jgi:hypothetical protein